MQVTIEPSEGLKRLLTVAVPGEKVDAAVNLKLQETAKTTFLKGYRKGKVPFKVVKNRYGLGIRREIVSQMIQQSYAEAIHREGLKPVGNPEVVNASNEEGADLVYTASFEVYPSIQLPDFSTLSIEKITAEIVEEDIDDMVDDLQRQRSRLVPVARESTWDDIVIFDYEGRVDGNLDESLCRQEARHVVGKITQLPGLGRVLYGRRANENEVVDFGLPLPEDYHVRKLAGAKAEFKLTIKQVLVREYPEIDEEFMSIFGIKDGDENAFRQEIRQNLLYTGEASTRRKLKADLHDSLIAAVEVELPQALIDAEIKKLKKGSKVEGLSEPVSASESDAPYLEEAQRRVKIGLILGEIAVQSGITIDEERLRRMIEREAVTYEAPVDVVNWIYKDEKLMSYYQSRVLEEQVIDHILETADISIKQISFDELVRKQDPAAQAAGAVHRATAET